MKFDAQLEKFKQKLNKISPTFCVAKWKQVTIHLESGLTHSCHHPRAHVVPLDELRENVSALHNTKFKKRMRKDMLEGKIVPECEYCNRVERSETNNCSDRIYKSMDHWAEKYIDEIVDCPWDYDIFPSYFEVSFSSVCNCACIYCSQTFSTGWVNEVKKYGGYPTNVASRSCHDTPPAKYMGKKYNPYIDAFWKWWPELYKNLHTFRITGGEPLLSKDTFKILDYIIENPRPDLEFYINSNFCVNPKIFNKFLDKYKQISKNHKHVGIYTSCEAKGKKADYIRTGLNYEEWLNNCRRYLSEIPNSSLYLMCTYNILSVTSFKDFLEDILNLKKEFLTKVYIDVPVLMNPVYLQANILTRDFLQYVEDCITYMYKNLDIATWPPLCGNRFFRGEILKLKRIYDMLNQKLSYKGNESFRKDFAIFIDEHDRRYGTNFLEVFPEYKEFYNKCRDLYYRG